jgi:hypothetical protein
MLHSVELLSIADTVHNVNINSSGISTQQVAINIYAFSERNATVHPLTSRMPVHSLYTTSD